MKVSYKIAGAVGAWTTLADDTAGSFNSTPAFSPSYSQQKLEVPLFNSPNMARAPLGNVKTTVSLAISVQYASLDLALQSLRTNPYFALVGAKFHLQVVQGSETHYYPNAVLDSYAPDLAGGAVVHKLTMSADQATAVAPS